MATKKPNKLNLTDQTKTALTNQPGLSVKDLASGLGVNRQFMAGFLTALEERGEVYHRQVGPARIYFTARQHEPLKTSSRPKVVAAKETENP